MAQMGKTKRPLIVKRNDKWSKKTKERKIKATGSNKPKERSFWEKVSSGAKIIGWHVASGARKTFTEENRNKLADFGERMGSAARKRRT